MPDAGEVGMDREARPGRPRDPQVDRAITQATLKLLSEQGYLGMSVEGVAAEAGVGKTTIYRRFPSKADLVVAAVSTIRDQASPLPDTGSLRTDLLGMMAQHQAAFRRGLALLGALLVEESRNPDLLDLFRERTLRPRRDEVVSMVQRSADRGEVRRDIDPEAAVHAIVGSMFVRRLLGIPDSEEWDRQTVEIVCRGLLADPGNR